MIQRHVIFDVNADLTLTCTVASVRDLGLIRTTPLAKNCDTYIFSADKKPESAGVSKVFLMDRLEKLE